MGNPRRINIVSIALVAFLVAGGFAGWKFGAVYWQKHKVTSAMEGVRFEAARINRMGASTTEDTLLERLRNEITGLGVDERYLEIYFEGDYSRLHVKYEVEVKFPFGIAKRMKFHAKTSIERKDL